MVEAERELKVQQLVSNKCVCVAGFGGGFIPGMSEEALNNIAIDSSGLLLWFTVSDKHLKVFFLGWQQWKYP